MKKAFTLLLALTMLLTGCSLRITVEEAPPAQTQEKSAYLIAATTAPIAQFTRALTQGTAIEVVCLVNEPVSCLHDYTLTVRQMKAIEEADLVILMLDSASELSEEDEEVIDLCSELENVIVLLNKSDKEAVIEPSDLPFMYIIRCSAQNGEGNEGGILPGEGAKDIAVVITHCDTPLAVSKLDSIKQFGPQENQFFDGTSIQARYLYDLFVPEKRLASIGAIVEG